MRSTLEAGEAGRRLRRPCGGDQACHVPAAAWSLVWGVRGCWAYPAATGLVLLPVKVR